MEDLYSMDYLKLLITMALIHVAATNRVGAQREPFSFTYPNMTEISHQCHDQRLGATDPYRGWLNFGMKKLVEDTSFSFPLSDGVSMSTIVVDKGKTVLFSQARCYQSRSTMASFIQCNMCLAKVSNWLLNVLCPTSRAAEMRVQDCRIKYDEKPLQNIYGIYMNS